MSLPESNLQAAVHDLALIRRSITRAQSATPGSRSTWDANLIIQALGLAVALFMIAIEIFTDDVMTHFMMASAYDREIGILGLIQVGVVLPTLVLSIYFIVWRASRKEGDDFDHYLRRDFHYLRNLGLVSDLLTKFIPVSFLVLAGQPQWIAPILCLFVADYLIQGRLFTLPVRASLSLAVASVGVGVAQYLNQSSALVWPLSLFAVAAAGSIACAWRQRKQAE